MSFFVMLASVFQIYVLKVYIQSKYFKLADFLNALRII